MHYGFCMYILVYLLSLSPSPSSPPASLAFWVWWVVHCITVWVWTIDSATKAKWFAGIHTVYMYMFLGAVHLLSSSLSLLSLAATLHSHCWRYSSCTAIPANHSTHIHKVFGVLSVLDLLLRCSPMVAWLLVCLMYPAQCYWLSSH